MPRANLEGRFPNQTWNPSVMATIGERSIGHYRGVVTKQGYLKCYSNDNGTKVSGCCREGGHTSGVAIKRGSTVLISEAYFVIEKATTLCFKSRQRFPNLEADFQISKSISNSRRQFPFISNSEDSTRRPS